MFVVFIMCCIHNVLDVGTVRMMKGGAAALPNAFIGSSSQSGPLSHVLLDLPSLYAAYYM